MSTTIAELMATLGLDSSDFNKELQGAKAKGEGFSSTMSGLATAGAGIFTAGFTAAAGGAALLGTELYKDIGIAQDSQKVQAQLEAVIKSTGGAAGITSEKANDLATSLMNVTTFDDEAIKSGESMLLTFTNIGKDVFPQATSTILDMSQALGQDLQSSAIQLGKALNDPVKGVTALQRVGVTFTEEQKKQIQGFMDVNDTASAQRVILAELTKEFGGSAKAAGQTAAGQMTIFKNTIDNIRESVGSKFLPILVKLGSTLQSELMKPEVMAFIDDLSTHIANFVQSAVDNVPRFIQGFKDAFAWLQNNQPIVVGVLSALGVALLAFAATSAIAAATAMAPFLPVIAIMAAVGVAAYLLYRAWTENWGGIQQTVGGIWANLQPIFTMIGNYLSVILPAELAIAKAGWDAFLNGLRVVWNFLSAYVFPIIGAVANVIGAVLGLQIRIAAGLFQNFFLPPLRAIFSFITGSVIPAVQRLADWLSSKLSPAFQGIGNAIKGVVNFLQTLASRINSIHLPSWLTPGSPTPFEIGLLGIAGALNKVNNIGFAPKLPANNLLTPARAADLNLAGTSNEPKQVSYHFEINNPKGETTEQSTTKSLKKLSYLGVAS